VRSNARLIIGQPLLDRLLSRGFFCFRSQCRVNDNLARIRELDRVANKIHHDLPQSPTVTVEHVGNIGSNTAGQFQSFFMGTQRKCSGCSLKSFANAERFRVQFKLTGFHTGKVEQVVEQVQQRLSRVASRFQIPLHTRRQVFAE
jgi:hypothetical protein